MALPFGNSMFGGSLGSTKGFFAPKIPVAANLPAGPATPQTPYQTPGTTGTDYTQFAHDWREQGNQGGLALDTSQYLPYRANPAIMGGLGATNNRLNRSLTFTTPTVNAGMYYQTADRSGRGANGTYLAPGVGTPMFDNRRDYQTAQMYSRWSGGQRGQWADNQFGAPSQGGSYVLNPTGVRTAYQYFHPAWEQTPVYRQPGSVPLWRKGMDG